MHYDDTATTRDDGQRACVGLSPAEIGVRRVHKEEYTIPLV
jgi:hypothetical protein